MNPEDKVSETPRVDALVRDIGQWKVVYAEDARQLERELAEANRKLANCHNWLRANANAENDPGKKSVFIEAHNAILSIVVPTP